MEKLEYDAIEVLRIIRAVNLLPKQDADTLLREISMNYSSIYEQSHKNILRQLRKLLKLFVLENNGNV